MAKKPSTNSRRSEGVEIQVSHYLPIVKERIDGNKHKESRSSAKKSIEKQTINWIIKLDENVDKQATTSPRPIEQIQTAE